MLRLVACCSSFGPAQPLKSLYIAEHGHAEPSPHRDASDDQCRSAVGDMQQLQRTNDVTQP